MFDMTKEQVKEILDRVLTWPQADQEKVARFAREVERRRDDEDHRGRNGGLLKNALPGTIWRAMKRLRPYSAVTATHEAPVRARGCGRGRANKASSLATM